MANGNVYAPLYSSVKARGTLSPLGTPTVLKPEVKKKALGDKMAQALGAMIDQSMESDKERKKKQIAQLEVEHDRLGKFFQNGRFVTDPGEGMDYWMWNKDYKGNQDAQPEWLDKAKYNAITEQLGQLKGISGFEERTPTAGKSIFDMQFDDEPRSDIVGSLIKKFIND